MSASNNLMAEGYLNFHWNEIMSNLDEFNKLLGTNFTSLSSRKLITETTMSLIGEFTVDVSKLAPFITKYDVSE
ncbi:hypothetical protein [Thomasclavelia cocleata]|uniref:hypothetical protein n=1 Tax=Thomasclavelia cocleata TaxID=69824 RepID=UPI002431D1F5|nr:hypothetical protein [Thomasclavelia cocleata]